MKHCLKNIFIDTYRFQLDHIVSHLRACTVHILDVGHVGSSLLGAAPNVSGILIEL